MLPRKCLLMAACPLLLPQPSALRSEALAAVMLLATIHSTSERCHASVQIPAIGTRHLPLADPNVQSGLR